MTGSRVFGAAMLAISVLASIASMVVHLPHESHPPQAIRWSKRAAERLDVAVRTSDTRMLFSALGAADHALRIDGRLADARFQRAAIFERLHLSGHASRAYADYLKIDPSSSRAELALHKARKLRALAPRDPYVAWGAAMKEIRAAALAGKSSVVIGIVRRFPAESGEFATSTLGRWAVAAERRPDDATNELTIARALGNALILVCGDRFGADAVAAIDAALKASDRRRISQLVHAHQLYAARGDGDWHGPIRESGLDTAISAFRQAKSPMARAAEYERASRQWFIPIEEGCRAIARLTEMTPPSYPGLRGLIYRRQSLCLATSGDSMKAVEAGRRSIALFVALNDHSNAISSLLVVTHYLQTIGDRDSIWQFRTDVLAMQERADDWPVNWLLMDIAREAVSERAWDLARSAATLVIDSRAPNNHLRVPARGLRAIAAWHQGEIQSAKYDLDQARLATTSTSEAAQSYEQRRIDRTELALMRQSEPARSKELLGKSLANALASRDPTARFYQHMEYARTYRKLKKHREAATELSRAINVLTQSRVAMAATDVMFSNPGGSADIHAELIDLLDTRDEAAAAFTVSEYARGHLLLSRMGYEGHAPITIEGVRRQLPFGTVIVSFVTLRDRLLIFSMDRRGSYVTRVRIGAAALRKRIDALKNAVQQRTDWRPAAAVLHETLFGSLRLKVDRYDTIVIVPDAVIEEIPLATLIDPATKRLLIERSSLVIAPSASVYVRFAAMNKAPLEHALIIGDPAFERTDFPQFQRLPAADKEATAIAALHGAKPLIGGVARLATALDRARVAGIIHIGAHTLISAAAPASSSILMSDGQLRVRDLVSRRVCPGSVAILAGCRTAARAGKADINSLALAFLAAGSRSSVGSLWDVQDAATRTFSVRLHQLLREGVGVSAAVRRVQLEMLLSSDPSLNNARSWAAFQVYGGG